MSYSVNLLRHSDSGGNFEKVLIVLVSVLFFALLIFFGWRGLIGWTVIVVLLMVIQYLRLLEQNKNPG